MSKLFVIIILIVVLIYILQYSDSRSKNLDSLLLHRWTKMFKNSPKTIGISAYIISPYGNFFGSSLEQGNQINWYFRGGSTTKMYTSAAIMLLNQRKLLNINDLIVDNIPGIQTPYIPNTINFDIPFKSSITIRQLLEMRAGVFDVINDPVPKTSKFPYAGFRYTKWVQDKDETHTFTFEELVGVLAKNKLTYGPPGEKYHYTDTGYNLLGVIIERISGKSLNSFLKYEFIDPLGLNDTTFPSIGTKQNLPKPYFEGMTKFEGEYIKTTDRNVSMNISEGNIVTTLPDLAKWTRLLAKGEVGINKFQINKMADCIPTEEIHKNYGLGITCNPTILGFGHDGNVMGYFTLARHNPITDITTVLLCTLFDADEPLEELKWFNDIATEIHDLASNNII